MVPKDPYLEMGGSPASSNDSSKQLMMKQDSLENTETQSSQRNTSDK